MSGLYNKELIKGENIIVPSSDSASKGADFGVVVLEKGMTFNKACEKEYLFCLNTGKIEIGFLSGTYTAERESCFEDDPTVLSLPAGSHVSFLCLSEYAEINFSRIDNAVDFEPRLITPDRLLSSSLADENVMGGRLLRKKRVFYDWNSHPESRLFCGEVVNFPGCWACYPPHLHDEPEIYYYKFSSSSGYGFSEYGDEARKVREHDAMLIPGNVRHSQVTVPDCFGYIMWTQPLKSNGSEIIYRQI